MSVIKVITEAFDYPPGPRWTPLTAGKVYSLQQQDADTFNYEVRGYDRYASPAYSDPPNVIRSECYGPEFPPGVAVEFDYTLTVAAGPATTNAWMIFGQLHSANDMLGASPLLALNVLGDGKGGELLHVNLNHRSEGETAFRYDNIGRPIPFVRGVPHRIRMLCVDSRGTANGHAKVTYDDAVLADYVGVTGYFGQIGNSYVKKGVYAGGKGASATAIPDPNQRIIASYYKPTFGLAV